MAKVFLAKGKGLRVENGHPWVFRHEVQKIDGEFEDGQIVDVFNFKGKFVGKGFINSKSQILVRLLTRKNEEISIDFFKKRIQDAWDYRKSIGYTQNCRLIFAEADFLPGLIVDKFGDVLVMQTLSKGVDKFKDKLVEILVEVVKPKAIYERNDARVREIEGLDLRKGFLYGSSPVEVEIEENGIKMIVDIENGQKTGYFLDQKENRVAIRNFVKDKVVLDCFCHTGGFTINAAKFGASKVIGIDISDTAIEQAVKNAKLNGVESKCEFVVANVFDYLNELDDKKEKYDMIILDPPAFAKSIHTLENAKRGYKEINLRAMKILKKGGILVTCSCSHYMKPDIFFEVIKDAAKDAKKTLRLIEYRTQAKDHPYLVNYEESLYLKCFIFQVL
ncbi:class I SAM-dependent rRNA methyltransferase [Anaerocellum diazotrophicum]|uniref:SAM-dependent methyltransferase n=1 Tax=Caldicellulosiruptor diazotrophicus TaxID=2806205 RepID=A0ABM7NMI3_9FIRM|nr:class I SAM-dependent rRNA methyltransferase [Caldicellulosiruptor diazotrophicus]BCS81329.1 SAM-dependent methyltransferase [Caldicellulosiruptor diazotrophicus]